MIEEQTKRDYQAPDLTTLDLLGEVVEGIEPIVSGELEK